MKLRLRIRDLREDNDMSQFYHLPCHGRTYPAPFETALASVQHT